MREEIMKNLHLTLIGDVTNKRKDNLAEYKKGSEEEIRRLQCLRRK